MQFCNNTLGKGEDPWVIEAGGYYWYCRSAKGGITIQKAKKLYEIADAEFHIVWMPPQNTMYSKELWAPELHYLFGAWYIYVAADDGKNENHRMYALKGGNNPNDPLDGEYTFAGKVTDKTDKWAIDATVAKIGGEHYFIWSGWTGDVDVSQELYIAKMDSATSICSERVQISHAEYDWELQGGNPKVNEGPAAIYGADGRVFILYSASGSWSDFYCLGMLELTGDDPLDPNSWTKHPEAVFSSHGTAFAPGHASFVKTPIEKQDWIVYHTARCKGAGWDRIVKIQPYEWEDGKPYFGYPLDTDTQIEKPKP